MESYCELYSRWSRKLDIVLRQEYRAGERLFVDHAGPKVPIVERETDHIRDASIFVAVLGASSYTYAEATWKSDLPCWIGSHIRTLEFINPVCDQPWAQEIDNAPCRKPGRPSEPKPDHKHLQLEFSMSPSHDFAAPNRSF